MTIISLSQEKMTVKACNILFTLYLRMCFTRIANIHICLCVPAQIKTHQNIQEFCPIKIIKGQNLDMQCFICDADIHQAAAS